MRVLLVHNYLLPPSGENTVFEQERVLLEDKGHEVLAYTRNNAEIRSRKLQGILRLGPKVLWARRTYEETRTLIKRFNPDVAHFHNVFPLISPSAYQACRGCTAIVQTLHSFRLICPGGFLFRNGSICHDCEGRNFIPAILHGCYRDSRILTAGMASAIYVHYLMKTWTDCVSQYIALSSFARDKFKELGFPSNRFSIKPNFITSRVEPCHQDEGYGVFVGRLGQEKGLACLLEALRSCPEIRFKILGDGPLKVWVANFLKDHDLGNVEFLGLLPHEKCMQVLLRSKFLVIPSIWYEGMPMVVTEAVAAAKPIVAADIGAIPEMIQDGVNGLLFEPGSVSQLIKKLKWMYSHPSEARLMGMRSLETISQEYFPERNYEILMEIYSKAVESYEQRHQ